MKSVTGSQRWRSNRFVDNVPSILPGRSKGRRRIDDASGVRPTSWRGARRIGQKVIGIFSRDFSTPRDWGRRPNSCQPVHDEQAGLRVRFRRGFGKAHLRACSGLAPTGGGLVVCSYDIPMMCPKAVRESWGKASRGSRQTRGTPKKTSLMITAKQGIRELAARGASRKLAGLFGSLMLTAPGWPPQARDGMS